MAEYLYSVHMGLHLVEPALAALKFLNLLGYVSSNLAQLKTESSSYSLLNNSRSVRWEYQFLVLPSFTIPF